MGVGSGSAVYLGTLVNGCLSNQANVARLVYIWGFSQGAHSFHLFGLHRAATLPTTWDSKPWTAPTDSRSVSRAASFPGSRPSDRICLASRGSSTIQRLAVIDCDDDDDEPLGVSPATQGKHFPEVAATSNLVCATQVSRPDWQASQVPSTPHPVLFNGQLNAD